MQGDGSVRIIGLFGFQPGNTGSAPGTISGRTSAQAGLSSAAEPDSCKTPRSSATYAVDVDVGDGVLRVGAADHDVVAGAPGQRHRRVAEPEAQPTRIGQRMTTAGS